MSYVECVIYMWGYNSYIARRQGTVDVYHGFVKDRKTYPLRREARQTTGICLPLLRETVSVLLAVSMRFSYLPEVHGGEPVGNVLQWNHLGVSGLRRSERIRKPVIIRNGCCRYRRTLDISGRALNVIRLADTWGIGQRAKSIENTRVVLYPLPHIYPVKCGSLFLWGPMLNLTVSQDIFQLT